MPRAIISPPAERDMLGILAYIARDNPGAGVKLVDRLEEKCKMLAESPDMGFPRYELLPQLRVWPVGNYLIFYRPVENDIEVVRVLHSARDIPAQFE